MKKDRSQFINTILIVAGAILLIFQLAREEREPYLLIIGLVLLMLGLYRATNHWSYTKDDHKNFPEDEEDGEKLEKHNEQNKNL